MAALERRNASLNSSKGNSYESQKHSCCSFFVYYPYIINGTSQPTPRTHRDYAFHLQKSPESPCSHYSHAETPVVVVVVVDAAAAAVVVQMDSHSSGLAAWWHSVAAPAALAHTSVEGRCHPPAASGVVVVGPFEDSCTRPVLTICPGEWTAGTEH